MQSNSLIIIFRFSDCNDIHQVPTAILPVRNVTEITAHVGGETNVTCEGFFGRLNAKNCGKDGRICGIIWYQMSHIGSFIRVIANHTADRVYTILTE
jgi:hypothetical protein